MLFFQLWGLQVINFEDSGGADFIFIPEQPPKSMPWEDEMCAAIHRVSPLPSIANSDRFEQTNQHREVGKRKTIVIVAEGAHDRDLNPIRAEYVKDVLSDRLGLDTRVTTLGHTQRGGRPCAYDRILVRFSVSVFNEQSSLIEPYIADVTGHRSC